MLDLKLDDSNFSVESILELSRALEIFKETEDRMTIDTEKEYSKEFQNNLLDLFEMCYENHTDTCTVTFEYPNSVMEIDFTFRARKRTEDENDN